ncbi:MULTISPECIES: hypothetical protein [Sphingobacterium]|uniref:Deacetylase sirtuin-type domain-containing protein n=1 Tax=Sphingobacterium populi TaxID=1812824 RepID=A0ABW5U999_9SPHI|nr:hypothetical protein [Sphingobacterium sp. CFCC 11742]
MGKTVYILGAGFSMEFGAPSQANLLKAIYDLKNHSNYSKLKKRKVNMWIEELDKFIVTSLKVSEEEKIHYPLEDIYTPIDKSIVEGCSFKDYDIYKLFTLRNTLNNLVMLALKNEIDKAVGKEALLEKFSQFIINQCKSRLLNESEDRVSIITTNWDIILDNSLHRTINKDPIPKGHKFSGVLDYCCYISSLDERDHKVKPGLYAIGKGRYNVKLLKLHGSLNWSQCPKCSRLYVKLYQRFNGAYIFKKYYCRHCEKNYNLNKCYTNKLFTNLITPTFLKNLNNIQNKLVWQNAGIELSEAEKIVFVGYSLPQADFEFKQLMSRMLRKDVNIEVYLTAQDNYLKLNGAIDYGKAGYRYRNFFSGRNIKMYFGGTLEFINNLSL